MHGQRQKSAALVASVAASQSRVSVVLCPPFTLLNLLAEQLSHSPVSLGAQDCHTDASGAFTGEISAEMLKDVGCDYVIVGHSERRQYYHEDNALVKNKAEAAHRAGLVAVICVGETLQQREEGNTLSCLTEQLQASLPSGANPANTVIAYEPVWAIGTGKIPTSQEIAEVHQHILSLLAPKANDAFHVLYGGSVKPNNADGILRTPGVDGLLVGGASLDASAFGQILDYAAQIASEKV